MTTVHAMLAPQFIRHAAMTGEEGLLGLIQVFHDEFEEYHGIQVPMTGVDAAEELFDLTNHPCRDEEREEWQWNARPLGVGDVVKVIEGTKVRNFLCDHIGWTELTFAI